MSLDLPIVSARSMRLADWRAARDAADFAALCNRLRVRKWYAANRARKLEYMAAYGSRPEVRARNAQAKRKSRAVAREAA